MMMTHFSKTHLHTITLPCANFHCWHLHDLETFSLHIVYQHHRQPPACTHLVYGYCEIIVIMSPIKPWHQPSHTMHIVPCPFTC
jgi:hypothetical protein